MPFDLPALLSEYLLPLLVLVPLAVVVVLIAARSHKDEHWSHSRQDLAPPPLPQPRAGVPRRPMPPVSAPPAPTLPSASPHALPRDAGPSTLPAPYESEFGQSASPFLEAPVAAPPALLREVGPSSAFAPTEPAALTPTPPPAARSAAPLPILIVDDSAVVRAKLGKLLTSQGYAVTAARHGAEALEQLGQQWFAVMITDLEMPEIDGFELIAQVSNDLRTDNLPIIAITGHEALQARVQDAQGLYGLFKKPWNDRELLQRVAALSLLRPRP